jgi:hypothetical protein
VIDHQKPIHGPFLIMSGPLSVFLNSSTGKRSDTMKITIGFLFSTLIFIFDILSQLVIPDISSLKMN